MSKAEVQPILPQTGSLDLPPLDELDISSAAERFEALHYAFEAPSLAAQVEAADTRSQQLLAFPASGGFRTSVGLNSVRPEDLESMSESEALHETVSYLEAFKDIESRSGRPDSALAELADKMLQELTYVSEAELQVATEVIATSWLTYLRDNPDHQLLILTSAHFSDGQDLGAPVTKSDGYLLDRIIATYAPDELEFLGGRMVTDVNHVRVAPEEMRAIVFDDWSISGLQFSDACYVLRPYLGQYFTRLEAHHVAASAANIENGLPIDMGDTDGEKVPLRAVFRATFDEARVDFIDDPYVTYDEDDLPFQKLHFTGAHSSVDFGFESSLRELQTRLYELHKSGLLESLPPMPRLARLWRQYHAQPRQFNIGEHEIVPLAKENGTVAKEGEPTPA